MLFPLADTTRLIVCSSNRRYSMSWLIGSWAHGSSFRGTQISQYDTIHYATSDHEDFTFLSLSDMGCLCGVDGDGDGWCGDVDDVVTSCGDRGGDVDESCGDGQGWVQISVPMSLSTLHKARRVTHTLTVTHICQSSDRYA